MSHDEKLHFAIPKGRMFSEIQTLLAEAGYPINISNRDYRASIPIQHVSCKILKPQSIVEMLAVGRRDLGFAGADWVAELQADVVEILDTKLNPVRIVVAAPYSFLEQGELPSTHQLGRPLILASEYKNLAQQWIDQKQIQATFVRSWGATEVLPPEDADFIIDNTATGSTLRANQLDIIDEVMRSTTRLYASREAMNTPWKVSKIQEISMILQSVLHARQRVMLEMNVTTELLNHLLQVLPAMRHPTISSLHNHKGYAVKAAVVRNGLAELLPLLKKAGATDLVVSRIDQILL